MSTSEQVNSKETELAQARSEAEALTEKIVHARELLSDYLCPYCEAALVERAYHSEIIEYQGREIDIDRDWSVFECGLEIIDGKERHPCGAVDDSDTTKES